MTTKEEADLKGAMKLNGIEIEYYFKENWLNGHTSHIEFYSKEEGKPNALTETGYRSFFPGTIIKKSEVIETIKQLIKQEVKKAYILEIEGQKEGNGEQISLLAY